RRRDRELHHRTGLGDAADPDLFRGAARGEARDQRDLHHGDRADRGGDRDRFTGLETVELARRECGAVVSGVLMKFAYQVLIHTPVWVFALLAFLVWQGIKATRPRTVTIWRSLIVPAVFIVWGLSRLVSRQDYAGLLTAWLGAAALL